MKILKISKLTVIITTATKEVICFPNIKTDGNKKKNNVYHTGVSIKKLVFIKLASTEAASKAAKNKPIENRNIKTLPTCLERPLAKISLKSYVFLLIAILNKYITKAIKIIQVINVYNQVSLPPVEMKIEG